MDHTVILSVVIAFIVLFLGFVIVVRMRRQAAHVPEAIANKPMNPEQVYIGNLHYRVREQDLRRYFEKYGRIQDLYIVKNRQNGRSKGYGFVTFERSGDANDALEAHGDMVNGRNLVVRIARQKD